LDFASGQPASKGIGCARAEGSGAVIPRQPSGRIVTAEPRLKKTTLYKPFKPHRALLPPPVPSC
jgi:hypothetical protein